MIDANSAWYEAKKKRRESTHVHWPTAPMAISLRFVDPPVAGCETKDKKKGTMAEQVSASFDRRDIELVTRVRDLKRTMFIVIQ